MKIRNSEKTNFCKTKLVFTAQSYHRKMYLLASGFENQFKIIIFGNYEKE